MSTRIKLSQWAKNNSLTYQSAYNLYKAGSLPKDLLITVLPTGTILVEEATKLLPERVVIYCRVSSRERNVNEQVERCLAYCSAKGYQVSKIYKETASGMNDNRKELWSMLDSMPSLIVVENKDRLTRFGYNYIAKLGDKLGIRIEVINQDSSSEKDLMKDFVSVITSFCCRLYSIRRGMNKAKQIKKALEDENN